MMRNKILSLILAILVFVPFNTKVSAVGPKTGGTEINEVWTTPCTIVAGVTLLIGMGYTGYKIYDYRCLNKVVSIEGNSSCGEYLEFDRADYEAKRQIRRVFDYELSRWKRYFDSSAPIKAVHLANVSNCLVDIRNYGQQQIITTPKFCQLCGKLWDKIAFFMRIMDTDHKVMIGELVRELKEADSLVDEATILIDAHYFSKID